MMRPRLREATWPCTWSVGKHDNRRCNGREVVRQNPPDAHDGTCVGGDPYRVLVMKTNSFKAEHEARAAAWKKRTATLPDAAREAAPYVSKDGPPHGRYPFCLPSAYADHNLLPDLRTGAIALFAELGIPWHAGIDGGPTNHLLS